MDLSVIQELISSGTIVWTVHSVEKMQERDISRDDVINCIMHGEIIEEYPDDYPHPSCLIYGHTSDERVIHTVVGFTDTQVFIVTLYEPNTIKFEEDLKTRRK